MSDEMNDDELDRLLRGADPLAEDDPSADPGSLRAFHAFRAQRLAESHARPGSRWARPRVIAGGTLAIGATATAATLALGAFNSAPAFAVTPNDNGTVTVKVFRAANVTDLNARLKALGVRARFIQVKALRGPCSAPDEVLPHAVVIRPGRIPAHTTIDLAADGSGHVGYLPRPVLERIAAHSAVPVMVRGVAVKIGTTTATAGTTTGTATTGTATTGTATTGTATTTAATTTAAPTTGTTGTSVTSVPAATGDGVGGASTQRPIATPVPPALVRAIAAVHCAANITAVASPGGGTPTTDSSTTDTDTSTTSTSTSTTGSTTDSTGTGTVPGQ